MGPDAMILVFFTKALFHLIKISMSKICFMERNSSLPDVEWFAWSQTDKEQNQNPNWTSSSGSFHGSIAAYVYFPHSSLSASNSFFTTYSFPRMPFPGCSPEFCNYPAFPWLPFRLKSFLLSQLKAARNPIPYTSLLWPCCPVQAALPVTSTVVLSRAHHSPPWVYFHVSYFTKL